MIKLGDKEVENRYITDDSGIPHEVVAVYVGNNLVYSAKIEETNAEFYKRKTGGTQSVGSGIAAIKEIRGKSIVWNQLVQNGDFHTATGLNAAGMCTISVANNVLTITKTGDGNGYCYNTNNSLLAHKYYYSIVAETEVAQQILVGYNVVGTNSYFNLSQGEKKRCAFVFSVQSATNTADRIYRPESYLAQGYKTMFSNNVCIDLTLMFGAGKEPATITEFEKMFPLEYYDYNAGEVIPFAGQNLVTTGKNQYNPATGKANLLGGQTYQIGGTYTSAEIDGVAVTLDSNNCFTTTKDCVLDVTGGNNTDTFVGLYNGETNTYEPYEKHTLPLDPLQWRDKQGNLVFPYGGMHGVGTAYDYAKVDADGYIRKAVRCFGSVYLKNLSWQMWPVSKYQPYGEFYARITDIKPSIGDITSIFRAICNVYETYRNISSFPTAAAKDKNCYMANNGGHEGKQVFITDSSYTSVTDFVAHFKDDDCLVYQLKTPVEVELATPVYAKYLVNKDGTEEITPANGTKPYTTMANLHLVYPKK